MTQWLLDRTFRTASGDEVRWAVLGDIGDRGEERAAAPAVVLLHGTPFSSYVWRGVARALAARCRVFVWDMPGYGASEKRDGQDVSLGAQARVFGELLAHWGLSRPAVVAHDFGGCVALRAHLLHGARYERLALVDPVALGPWGSPTYRLLGAHPEVFGQLPPALHRALVREYVASAAHQGLHPAVLERLVEPWCTGEGQPAFYRQIAQNDQRFTDEVAGRYGEIELPVLVCWGAQDDWIPLAKGRELVSRIPGARLRVIEGAGHLVQEDAPAELTAALAVFLGAGA
ncbi:alpha/beta fold hydrolase [Streptomyces sp. NPDC101227]|uniref:alpha/beta fold hydrolase n=1 Tax=Streptomyces sp. NPDC101227 TaxID=3366136 RepID=UPI00380CBE60